MICIIHMISLIFSVLQNLKIAFNKTITTHTSNDFLKF